jgi:predicted N-acyltransferase
MRKNSWTNWALPAESAVENLTARFHSRLDDIDAAQWNALLRDDNPFLDHAFLAGLEQYGCLDAEHGWIPRHLGLYRGGDLAACAPLYVKLNSHGEYVFDWSWASAYARAGLDYYPKLLCAVPYSPVPGPRLLVGTGGDELRRALSEMIIAEVERHCWSSAHLNFAKGEDAAALASTGWLPRFDWQFHWHNRGWRDFDDFLDALTPKKRKNIRQERAQVTRAGVTCELRHGDELSDADWHAVHAFYQSTFDEKGNYAALTLDFFQHIAKAMPRRVLAVLCRRGDRLVAGAILLRGGDTLYGRYWGCSEQIPGLHFEACYYQGIDYCLRHGLQRFEPGAQGEHKLARGFLPVATHSCHYLADPRFRADVRDALAREGAHLRAYRDELMAHSPYANRGTEAA